MTAVSLKRLEVLGIAPKRLEAHRSEQNCDQFFFRRPVALACNNKWRRHIEKINKFDYTTRS